MSSRGRGRRNNSVHGVQAQLGMLKSSLHGHANKLTTSNPPSFTRRPYNTVTIESILTAADAKITLIDIKDALRAQLMGTTGSTVPISIKIKRIDLWAPSGSDGAIPSIRGTFYGLNIVFNQGASASGVSVPLKSLEDIGTPGASAAVVSYSWPRDQGDIPLHDNVGVGHFPVFGYVRTGATQVYARYHLLWNTGEGYKEPIVGSEKILSEVQ